MATSQPIEEFIIVKRRLGPKARRRMPTREDCKCCPLRVHNFGTETRNSSGALGRNDADGGDPWQDVRKFQARRKYQHWRDAPEAQQAQDGSVKCFVDGESGAVQALAVNEEHVRGFGCLCVLIDSGASGSALPPGMPRRMNKGN